LWWKYLCAIIDIRNCNWIIYVQYLIISKYFCLSGVIWSILRTTMEIIIIMIIIIIIKTLFNKRTHLKNISIFHEALNKEQYKFNIFKLLMSAYAFFLCHPWYWIYGINTCTFIFTCISWCWHWICSCFMTCIFYQNKTIYLSMSYDNSFHVY
jgi:hypothetical protein